MTEVSILFPIIPAAPGTKLLRHGKPAVPIIGWRVVSRKYAEPVAASAPMGTTIVVPGQDGDEITVAGSRGETGDL